MPEKVCVEGSELIVQLPFSIQ